MPRFRRGDRVRMLAGGSTTTYVVKEVRCLHGIYVYRVVPVYGEGRIDCPVIWRSEGALEAAV